MQPNGYNTHNVDVPVAVSPLSVKFAKFEDSKITSVNVLY